MIEIKHLHTQKLPNEASRLTFEIEYQVGTNFECELVIELRWFWGLLQEISIGNYHLQKDSFEETFHVDNRQKKLKVQLATNRVNSIPWILFKDKRKRGNNKALINISNLIQKSQPKNGDILTSV